MHKRSPCCLVVNHCIFCFTDKNTKSKRPFLTNPPHYAIIRTSADCAFAGNQATERIESYHDTIQGSKKVEGCDLQL